MGNCEILLLLLVLKSIRYGRGKQHRTFFKGMNNSSSGNRIGMEKHIFQICLKRFIRSFSCASVARSVNQANRTAFYVAANYKMFIRIIMVQLTEQKVNRMLVKSNFHSNRTPHMLNVDRGH